MPDSMNANTLRETLQEIEQHCRDNRIPLFYGRVKTKAKRTVVWEDNDPIDWKACLAPLALLPFKVLDVQIFNTEKLKTYSDQPSPPNENNLATNLQDDKQSALQTEKPAADICEIVLTFFHQRRAYQWVERITQEGRVTHHGLTEEEREQAEDRRVDAYFDSLVDSEAEKILLNPIFFNAPTEEQRRRAVFLLLELTPFNSAQKTCIGLKCEERFQAEAERSKEYWRKSMN